MVIKNFLFTILYMIVVLFQIIGGTMIRYRHLRENTAYQNYTDNAVLVEALKQELNMQAYFAKIFIPILVIVDIIFLWIEL